MILFKKKIQKNANAFVNLIKVKINFKIIFFASHYLIFDYQMCPLCSLVSEASEW